MFFHHVELKGLHLLDFFTQSLHKTEGKQVILSYHWTIIIATWYGMIWCMHPYAWTLDLNLQASQFLFAMWTYIHVHVWRNKQPLKNLIYQQVKKLYIYLHNDIRWFTTGLTVSSSIDSGHFDFFFFLLKNKYF